MLGPTVLRTEVQIILKTQSPLSEVPVLIVPL